MSCSRPELSDKLLLYIEEELTGDEKKEITGHVSQCLNCSQEVKNLKSMVATFSEMRNPPVELKVHPTADELTRFFYSRKDLDEETRTRISAHVFQCPQCLEEVKLLLECPDLAELEAVEESVEIPSVLTAKFRELYGTKQPAKSPGEKMEKTPSFWEQLRSIFAPRYRFAYASAFVVIILVMSFFLILGPQFGSRIGSRNLLSYSGKSKFVEFPIENISNKERDGFALYLINKGVPIQIQDGKLLVRKNRIGDARSHLTAYQDRRLLAAATETMAPPSDFIPTPKGGSPPDNNYTAVRYETPGKDIENPDRDHIPDLAGALEESRKYPVVPPSSTGKTSAKKIAKNAKGEEWIPLPEAEGSNIGIIPADTIMIGNIQEDMNVTADLKTSLRIQNAFLEVESDLKRNKTDLSNDQPARTPESCVTPAPGTHLAGEENKGGMISSSQVDEGSGGPLSLDELEEWEKCTQNLQIELQTKIAKILKADRTLPRCWPKAFVTLSFRKNEANKFTVRSVTFHIEHLGTLTEAQQDKIKSLIKKELRWEGLWDERFEFIPVK